MPRFATFFAALLALWLCVTATSAFGQEIVFGMSAAFSGPNRGMGVEFHRGLMACLDQASASGAANGAHLSVIALDDGYDPEPAVHNTIHLVKEDQVFALTSYVGTPTVTRMLPALEKFRDQDIFLLFPLTGAEPLRSPPYARYVYNLRASYAQETRGLVSRFLSLGRRRIAVFYQADAYGRSGWFGVRRALKDMGLDICGEAAYSRGRSFADSLQREVAILAATGPDAIIVIGAAASAAAFIRDARDAGLTVPIANVSFANADEMLRFLVEASYGQSTDYTADLIHSQVVPSYEDLTLPAVRRYRELMAARPGLRGDQPLVEPYTPHTSSIISLEGYLNGLLLVEMIRRMGQDVRRARIPEILEGMRELDLGLDVPVRFGPERHQGLDTVYYTTFRGNRLVPIKDWGGWAK